MIRLPMAASRSTASPPRSVRGVSLAGALFGTTQQRVLALLFGQPDRSFYANEVIALTRAGSGAVQRELARLAQSELVTVRVSGKQKHYQANPASPIFDELCGIVRKTVGLAEPLRAALVPLTGRIRAAFVFGSIAKQEDTAGSDIDLFLVSDGVGYAEVFAVLEPLGRQLGRSVNPTIFTTEELGRRIAGGESFVRRVLDQPKIWLIGGDDALGL